MKKLLSLSLFVLAIFAFTATAEVVQPIGAAPQVLIPAAGSVPGLNGTFFHSDVTIVNLASHDQLVLAQWIPQPGASPVSAPLTIKALSGFRSTDFVAEVFHTTGLGAVLLTGMQADGTTGDTTARLFASSRIWTPQPGANGTTSQSLPAVPPATISTPAAALFGMGGADNPSNYRSNVGIVNLDPTATQTFTVQYQTSPTSALQMVAVSLPPMTMTQVSVGTVQPGEQVLIFNSTPTSSPRSNFWMAYGSTVDNVTGDAWSEIGVAGTPSS
jgi:hypothetical protein